MSPSRLAWTWLGSLATAVACALVGVATGPSDAGFSALLADLLDPGAAGHDAARAILVDVRMLRVGGSFAVGAALSLAGVLLQAATRNPIADPYLVGTSAGATLAAVGLGTVAAAMGGAVSAQVLGALPWLQPLAAFGGAMLAVSAAFWLARAGGPSSPVRVLLAGLVLTAFGGAATSFLLYQASDLQLRAATGWLMGGVVAASGWQLLPAALVIVLATVWGVGRAVHLNALGLGEDAARGVGVDDGAMLKHAVWLSSALAAVAVALAGIVGFVGLLVPHGLRAVVGRDHRALVPSSVLVGGGFLVLADAVARVIVAPAELPVGILTALTGCPLLLGLLRPRRGLTSVRGQDRREGPTAAQSQGHDEPAAQRDDDGPAELLGCEGLTAGYVPGRPVVVNVQLQGRQGELLALVGPNGSGKSTLLRALAGGMKSEGELRDLGAVRRDRQRVDAQHVAWLPQRPHFEPGATVWELVSLGRTPYLAATVAGRLLGQPSTEDVAAVEQALRITELADKRDEPVANLSGGQQQRAFLAMTVAQQARVMLLDEPTTALDLPRAAAILDTLKGWAHRTGGCCIVAIHDLPLAMARADRLLVMKDGCLVASERPGPEALPALELAFGSSIREFVAGRV